MLDAYLLSLVNEYLQLIALTTSGHYEGTEYRALDSQRTAVHDELIRVLGAEFERPFDMASYCRSLTHPRL